MNKGVVVALFVVIAAILVGKFVFLDENRDMVSPKRVEDVPVPEKQPAPEPEPKAPRYPISEVRVDAGMREMPEPPEEDPLPPLEESDAPLREAAAALSAAERLQKLVLFESLIRHFVVTVDNMTREKLPQKYRFAAEVPESFKVEKTAEEGRYVLDPANFDRYDAFVSLAEAVDLRALVRIYTRFYPLFQQAYEALGYPDRYFNDRLIEVIDHVLAAPAVEGRVELVRPKVFYQFADPDLEALSAGQKLLIRMGPAHAERIRARLRELRTLLVRSGS